VLHIHAHLKSPALLHSKAPTLIKKYIVETHCTHTCAMAVTSSPTSRLASPNAPPNVTCTLNIASPQFLPSPNSSSRLPLILHDPQSLSHIPPRSLELVLFLVLFHLELLQKHAGVEEAI